MPGSLLDLFAHVIIAVKVENIGYQVQSVLKILNLTIEAREVESIGQVLLVNIAKILIAARCNELNTHERFVS